MPHPKGHIAPASSKVLGSHLTIQAKFGGADIQLT